MKTKHFFDIGGNTGQTFDWLKTLPQDYSDHAIWVFEPSPRHFAKLIAKCRENHPRYAITLCPFGLGGKTETPTFFEKDDDKGDSFEVWMQADHKIRNIMNEQGYRIQSAIVSLPEFILENTMEGDEIILDIDAEGSEYAMLTALIGSPSALARVTEIFVEFHFIKNTARFMTKGVILDELSKHSIKIHLRGFA